MPKTSKSNTASAVMDAPVSAATIKPTSPAKDAQSKVRGGNGAAKEPAKLLQPIGEHFPAPAEHEITLKYLSGDAREVKVAGNFNAWRPEAAPLKKTGTSEWTVSLTLRPGHYEYRFVVDGRWVEDPQASQRGPNPYGGFNSILSVPLAAR